MGNTPSTGATESTAAAARPARYGSGTAAVLWGVLTTIGRPSPAALALLRSGDPVVEHPFFGEQILRELETMHGWDEGFVRLGERPFIRESSTGVVVGLAATDSTAVPEQQHGGPVESGALTAEVLELV